MIGLVIAGPWLTMTGARVLARRASRPGDADRRPAARRRPAGRVPRGQRPGPGAVHHHRGRRARSPRRTPRRRPARRRGGQQHPGGRPVRRPRPPTAARPLTGSGAAAARTGAGPAARRSTASRASSRFRADRELTIPRSRASALRIHRLGTRPRAGVVRPARERSWPRPLPGRGGSGDVPRLPGPLPRRQEPGGVHLAGRRSSPPARLDSLALASLDVATNGSQPAIEQARTVLENAYAYPGLGAAANARRDHRGGQRGDNAFQQLADRGDPDQPGRSPAAPWRRASRAGWPTASARSACCGSPAPGSPCCATSSPWKAPSRCSPSPRSRSAPGSPPPRCTRPWSMQLPLVSPGAAYYISTAAGIVAGPRPHPGHVPAAAPASPARNRQKRMTGPAPAQHLPVADFHDPFRITMGDAGPGFSACRSARQLANMPGS